MNASRSQIVTQYERAKKLGWIPHFLAAEQQHTKDYFDAADLMGIGSRETNLDPKWLKKAGDGGHGYGLLQADDRSFPGWIATGEWHSAESGINKGAEILMMKWRDMEECAGKRVSVKGKTFTGPKLSGFKAQQAVISSYNCGRWALYAAANGKDVDAYSTGKDYSSDVIDRARIFRELLKKDSAATAATQTSNELDKHSENTLKDGTATQSPPNNSTNKEVTAEITPEGGVKLSSSEGTPAPKERIAIIKATPKKWYQGLGTKITTLVTGNALFQWVWGQIETISALSVPPFVWYSVSAIVVVGGLIWIIHEVVSAHQDKTIQAEVDKLLVEQNSTPENLAQLIPANQVDLYRAKGYKIITRGDGSTVPVPPQPEDH